jgi:hypothetical protein
LAVYPDAEVMDFGPPDLGDHPDATPLDLGLPDAGAWPDASSVDTGVLDAGAHPDAELSDLGASDTGIWPDAARIDAGVADTGLWPDAEPLDAGVWPDAQPVDVGFPDSGFNADAAIPDAGPADTGVSPDAGFPRTATVNFTGLGRGQVWSGSMHMPGVYRTYTCDYDGVTMTLVCEEHVLGVPSPYYSASGSALLSVSFGFDNTEVTFAGRAATNSQSQFGGFTGHCVLPPPVSNGCALRYLTAPVTHRTATVRFD